VLTPHRRIDARRNCEVILRAADDAFAQESGVVSLAEIARRTGLSRATVYRHFRDRQALGAAHVARELATLRRIVKATDGQHRCFRHLLHLVLTTQVARRPLVSLFRELPERDQQKYAGALIAALTPAFHDAQAHGELRDDVAPADLVLVFEMIEGALSARSTTHDRDTTQRLIAVVIDGLFATS
jgi:AcrR family transcriptional regulator